ncbi:MAG: hypothetical protein KGQ36_01945 [Rickettsiales bacterium]|nr:hypothetical protein [Rickettsiales bacterium]
MKTHHFFPLVIFLSFLNPISAFALDSESDREKIVSAKARRFVKSSLTNQSFLVSGNYNSDQNSKDYHVDSRYYYRSARQMHEIYLFQETKYADQTLAGKRSLVKKSERYDGTISSKFMIADSNNYTTLYSRANYDDLSAYYYDLRNAAGLGRIMFNDTVEFDTSIGYTDVKQYGSKIFVLPSLRINLRLTEKVTFTQRGYFFIDHEGIDDDIRSSLKYKIGKNVSLALNHIFEKRRYGDQSNNKTVNQVHRYVSVGLVFDLD